MPLKESLRYFISMSLERNVYSIRDGSMNSALCSDVTQHCIMHYCSLIRELWKSSQRLVGGRLAPCVLSPPCPNPAANVTSSRKLRKKEKQFATTVAIDK